MTLRSVLRRVPGLRPAYHLVRRRRHRFLRWVGDRATFERLPPEMAVALTYEVMLGRKPSWDSVQAQVAAVRHGDLSRDDIVHMVRGSEEFGTRSRYAAGLLGFSIHSGRSQFIQLLPPARHILDLGGTHKGNETGAMVALGYPYRFDELVIVDLPSEERHEIYRTSTRPTRVDTALGPVQYRYHSMADLSAYEDGRFGLVYSGQSFEHVTRAEGASVLEQIHRVLEPGGWLAMDTPNARVTRLQQEEFIDPDHKVEYRLDELVEMLVTAGFVGTVSMGLNWAGPCLEAGKFDMSQVARRPRLFAQADECYILCLLCQKPAAASAPGRAR